jgi:hypothetical protein
MSDASGSGNETLPSVEASQSAIAEAKRRWLIVTVSPRGTVDGGSDSSSIGADVGDQTDSAGVEVEVGVVVVDRVVAAFSSPPPQPTGTSKPTAASAATLIFLSHEFSP